MQSVLCVRVKGAAPRKKREVHWGWVKGQEERSAGTHAPSTPAGARRKQPSQHTAMVCGERDHREGLCGPSHPAPVQLGMP